MRENNLMEIQTSAFYSNPAFYSNWMFMMCFLGIQFCCYLYIIILCTGPFITLRLTLKAPITTTADNSHKYLFIVFQRK